MSWKGGKNNATVHMSTADEDDQSHHGYSDGWQTHGKYKYHRKENWNTGPRDRTWNFVTGEEPWLRHHNYEEDTQNSEWEQVSTQDAWTQRNEAYDKWEKKRTPQTTDIW